MNRLSGKTALITGAAQGIGAAIAQLFVAEGAMVYVSDINHEKGQQLAKQVGNQAAYIPLDVSKENEWQKACDYILEQSGKLDIVVNNAGVTGYHANLGPQDPEHASLESWEAVHAVNLNGVFLGCKYAIKAMKNTSGGGSIVNISSRSGLVGIPQAAAYASSKAAVRNHTKSVALYCAEMGYAIRCNSIHPAAILTEMWETMLGTGEQREKNIQLFTREVPQKRFGKPEEVAYAALYLASDESAYITGIELTIDGGILAGAAATPGK